MGDALAKSGEIFPIAADLMHADHGLAYFNFDRNEKIGSARGAVGLDIAKAAGWSRWRGDRHADVV